VDLRAGPADLEKTKFLTLVGLELPTTASSSPWAVAIQTTLSRLLTCLIYKTIFDEAS
jgi:hypothetical protein